MTYQWSWSRYLLGSLWLFQYIPPSNLNLCTSAHNPSCDCVNMNGGDQQLLQVDCTHRNLSTIPGIGNLGNVVQLDFSWNQVTSLPVEAFRGLRLVNFGGQDSRLKLNFNPISYIDNGAFWDLEAEGFVLDIKYPKLESFPSVALRGAPNLTELYFWHSHMTSLAARAFEGLAKLRKLDLTGNRLGYLHPGVFVGLEKSLESLTLRNMDLTQFPQAAIRNLENLRELNLDENQITILRESSLQSLATRHGLTLSLQHNMLTAIAPNAFSVGYFELVSLQLTANNISDISFLKNPCGHIYAQFMVVDLTLNPVLCTCDALEVLASSFYVFRGECARPDNAAGLSLITDHSGRLPVYNILQIKSHCGNVTEQQLFCSPDGGNGETSGVQKRKACPLEFTFMLLMNYLLLHVFKI